MKLVFSVLLFPVLALSATSAIGLAKKSASAGQVEFTTVLVRDTVRVGEPLLVTCVVRNVTSDTQFVPITTPDILQSCGVYDVVDASGLSFGLKPWSAFWLSWSSSSSMSVPPGDSIYWHQLLPLDHYYRYVDRKQIQLQQVPGNYGLVTRLALPVFAAGDDFPIRGEHLTFTDTTRFVLRSDPKLSRFIKPYREALSIGLWTCFATAQPEQMRRVWKSLASRPASADGSYPYLEYVTAHALSVIRGGSPDAITEGRRFTTKYADHPLAEEMAFDMWFFFHRLKWRASRDSTGQRLLEDYPRNTRSMLIRWTMHEGEQ